MCDNDNDDEFKVRDRVCPICGEEIPHDQILCPFCLVLTIITDLG